MGYRETVKMDNNVEARVKLCIDINFALHWQSNRINLFILQFFNLNNILITKLQEIATKWLCKKYYTASHKRIYKIVSKFCFYSPCNDQKTKAFLMISGGIEVY